MIQTHLPSNNGENSSVLESPAVTGEELQEQEQSQIVSNPPTEPSAEWEALLTSLQQERKQRQTWIAWTVLFMFIGVPFFLAAVISAFVAPKTIWPKFCMYVSSLTYISAWFMALGPVLLGRKAARRLAQLDDPRCIGLLVDIWGGQKSSDYDRKTRRLAERALTRSLLHLKASDAELLNEKQRAILRRTLAMNGYIAFGKYRDPDLLIAVLKALEQIGDWRCEPLVRTMAETAKDKSVQEAARNCLPYLEMLAAKERVGENLLRASDKPASGPDILLRPATGSVETASQQLLHPVDNTTEQAHAE
jgi:hypothetical protein